MAMPLISSSDLVVASGHPRYPNNDVKNRAGRYIHAQMLIEHDSEGRHSARYQALACEEGTFTGNGSAQAVPLTRKITPVYISVAEVADTDTQYVTNGGFDSATTGWAVTGGTIASVAGGQTGNCCEVTQGTTELVTNGTFDSDVTGWTTNDPSTTLTLDSGGQAGNCCKINNTSSGVGGMIQSLTTIEGGAYTVTGYAKGANDPYTTFPCSVYAGSSTLNFDALTTWTSFSLLFSGAIGTTTSLQLWRQYTGGATLRWFDTISCYSLPVVTQSLTTTAGVRYRLTGYVKAGTAGNIGYAVGATGITSLTGTASGSWVAFSLDFTATGASTEIFLRKNSNASGTLLFDTISVTEQPKEQAFLLSWASTAWGGWYGRTTTTYKADLIYNPTEGSFYVAAGDGINNNGVTNYYQVWGYDIDETYTRDAGGTDPDWVEDGEAGQGGAVGTEVANKVETHIETQFLEEHADAGTHATNPYASTSKIEGYVFMATGSLQTVTLRNAIDIDYLEIWKTNSLVLMASSTMASGKTKLEGTAAFATGQIGSLGTGSFTFTGTAGAAYWYLAIGK